MKMEHRLAGEYQSTAFDAVHQLNMGRLSDRQFREIVADAVRAIRDLVGPKSAYDYFNGIRMDYKRTFGVTWRTQSR